MLNWINNNKNVKLKAYEYIRVLDVLSGYKVDKIDFENILKCSLNTVKETKDLQSIYFSAVRGFSNLSERDKTNEYFRKINRSFISYFSILKLIEESMALERTKILREVFLEATETFKRQNNIYSKTIDAVGKIYGTTDSKDLDKVEYVRSFCREVLEDLIDGQEIPVYLEKSLKKLFSLFESEFRVKTNVEIGRDGLCSCGINVLSNVTAEEVENVKDNIDNYRMKKAESKCWVDFKEWLEKRDKVDVVVDGANVATFGERGRSKFYFCSLVVAIKEIESFGQSYVVVLQEYHLSQLSGDEESLGYFDKLLKENKLFLIKSRYHYDDYYWLYMALDMDAKVLTNDKLRDHKSLFKRNIFIPWKTNKLISFSSIRNEKTKIIESIGINPPKPNSKCSRIDYKENGEVEGYHFKVESSNGKSKNKWLCVRPNEE